MNELADEELAARDLTEKRRGVFLLIEESSPAAERNPKAKGPCRFGWFKVTFVGAVFHEDDPTRVHVSLYGRGPEYRVSFAHDDKVSIRYGHLIE